MIERVGEYVAVVGKSKKNQRRWLLWGVSVYRDDYDLGV